MIFNKLFFFLTIASIVFTVYSPPLLVVVQPKLCTIICVDMLFALNCCTSSTLKALHQFMSFVGHGYNLYPCMVDFGVTPKNQ